MILLCVIFYFSSLHTADAFTSEKIIQLGDLRFTQILATHYDCCKQNDLRHFSSTRVRKCTQAPPETKYTRTLASVLIRATAKRYKTFRCSANVKNNGTSGAQFSQYKWHRHDRIDWHTNSKPLPTELNPNENKKPIRKLSATDSVELEQYSFNGSFSYFEGLSFQVQNEKKT